MSKTIGKLKKSTVLIGFGLFLTLIVIAFIPSFLYANRLYPNTFVNGIDVGNLTFDEASSKIETSLTIPDSLTLTHDKQSFTLSLNDLQFSYDIQSTLESLNHTNSQNTPFTQLVQSWTSLAQKHESSLKLSLNELLLNEHLSVIADEITTKPVKPRLSLEQSQVVVSEGSMGTDINVATLQNTIVKNLSLQDFQTIEIIVSTIDPTLDESQILQFKQRGERLAGKEIIFQLDRYSYPLSEMLLSLLSGSDGYDKATIDATITHIANDLDREPVNSVFNYENNKVVEFSPAKDGLAVNKELLSELIIQSLQTLEASDEASIKIEIPVSKTPPSVSTEEVNNLGIKELIGYGDSKFAGSIASRIHNIGLGASKFNGVLVAPGETLSFNDIIGDISSLTGYKQSYVIQDGKTTLGDGGGVCQVSTTLFRAALNAGLPITERRSHSYRVTYYEQGTPPGLDATIYSPTTDLKIENDTGNHLLIQTLFDPEKATLVFEIYGTSDGREVTLTTPVISSQSPPPEPLYQDDPTLPEGTIKQIDWAAWGAKVSFDYKVVRAGEVLEDRTFYSNYHPWQAKFLKGTGPTI